MLSLRKTFTATALALALGGALPAVLSTACLLYTSRCV